LGLGSGFFASKKFAKDAKRQAHGGDAGRDFGFNDPDPFNLTMPKPVDHCNQPVYPVSPPLLV
jgi:hypothetical protein